MRAGGTPSVDDVSMWSDDGTPWVAIGDMTASEIVRGTQRLVSPRGVKAKSLPIGHPGTLLFAMYASVGAIAVLGIEATWNQAILGIEARPGFCDVRFLMYWLQNLKPDLPALVRSNTQDNLNAEQVGNFPFPVLPMDRQRAIADHLDAETARIDALIAKKRRMIELLDEQFFVFTDQVVWKGVEARTPLMFLTDPARPVMYGIVLPGPDVADGIPIVKGGDVVARRLSPSLLNRTTREIEAPYARARLAVDDLVFAIRGGVGDVEMVPTELSGANITQDVARIAPGRGISPQWLRFVLMTGAVKAQVAARITGATIKGLNIWDLKRILVPASHQIRQERDLVLLVNAEQRLGRLRAALGGQIDLLVEHRQALITAAVTGALDIPGVAA